MRSPRLILPVVAAAVLGIVASGCSDQTDAARVGDVTLSESDLVDEVKDVAANDQLFSGSELSADGEMRGSYNQELVGQVLQQRIIFMLYDRAAEEQDIAITDTHRGDAQTYWESQLGPAFGGFPARYQEQLVDDVATALAVEEAIGIEGMLELANDVEIEPRFGSWDPSNLDPNSAEPAVLAPDGPLAAAADAASASE